MDGGPRAVGAEVAEVMRVPEIAEQAARVAPRGTILMVPGGSYAYGLATEDSDLDFRGVFTEDPELFWGVGHGRETIEQKDPDVVVHELGKFCRLALKGNPSVLEVLWTDWGYVTAAGLALQRLRKSFLSKRSLEPYRGYIKSQLWRLDHNHKPTTGTRGADPKYSMHIIRLCYAAIRLATDGEVMVDAGLARDTLMTVRAGEWSLGQVKEHAEAVLMSLEMLIPKAPLPDEPNVAMIEEFVRSVRIADFNRKAVTGHHAGLCISAVPPTRRRMVEELEVPPPSSAAQRATHYTESAAPPEVPAADATTPGE